MNDLNRPAWAQYRAIDKRGAWWWYSRKPTLNETNGTWNLESGSGSKVRKIEGAQYPMPKDWRESLFKYHDSKDDRIDLIGQNGNTGEHYDPAATIRDMSEPMIYTTARELRITHDEGYIDVEFVEYGGVIARDEYGNDVHIPSLAVLDAVRDAMVRIVGE